MQYYGRRSCNVLPEEDFGPGGYIGSSKYPGFIEDQKINPDNYSYCIIGRFTYMELAIYYEEWIHNKYNVSVNDIFFNICKAAANGFNLSGGNHTSKTKEILSQKTSAYFNNIDTGEEHRNHIRNKRIAWFNDIEFGERRRRRRGAEEQAWWDDIEFGEQRRQNISGGNSPQARGVIKLHPETHKFIKKWDTIRQASKDCNIDENAIGNCAHNNALGKNSLSGNFRWEFEDGKPKTKKKKDSI